MKPPYAHFRHCPRCGAAGITPPAPDRPLRCEACGFVYFLNPTVAVGMFVVRPDGHSLWLRRAKDPGRGRLGLAGGFIDMGETAEAAIERELLEEVGLEPAEVRFVCSEPNEYDYAEVRYPVCDLFFEVRVKASEVARAQAEEVEGWLWLEPGEVEIDQIAFASVRRAFPRWRGQGACLDRGGMMDRPVGSRSGKGAFER